MSNASRLCLTAFIAFASAAGCDSFNGGYDQSEPGEEVIEEEPPPPLGEHPVEQPWDVSAHADLPRGLRWVRSNPSFVSALNVVGELPSEEFVDAYFDDFGANAAHQWMRGTPNRVEAWMATDRPDARWVSWTMNDGASAEGRELIGGLPANSPGRIGYQVGDEPDDMDELKEMEAGINAIRAVDADALLYCNFYNPTSSEQLEYYAEMDADLISYDFYRLDARDYYEIINRFREAGLDSNRPYWRYSKSFYHEGEGEPAMSESDLRWGALIGLVYGYTGHTFFLYRVPDNNTELEPALFESDATPNRTPQYAWAAQINRELKAYGRAVTQLTSTSISMQQFVSGSFPLPPTVERWLPGTGGDGYLRSIESDSGDLDVLVGTFEDEAGDVYIMLQNQRHKTASFPDASEDAATIDLTFDFSSAPAGFDPSQLLWLDGKNNAVVSVSLSAHGSTASTRVTLAAGDIFFYKYATGRGFAIQPAHFANSK